MSSHLKALASRTNPESLALFPLQGAILLPACDLPLNVFEPRYLNLVDDALKADRLIGIIQPFDNAIHKTGGLGRIIQFAEMDNGQYMIVLRGLKRFLVIEELQVKTPYRQAKVDFTDFQNDIEIHDKTPKSEALSGNKQAQKEKRNALIVAMKTYAKHLGVELDWEALAKMPLPHLIDQTAQISPFEPNDKQSLLEAKTHEERRRLLIGLMHLYSGNSGSMMQ